MFMRQNAGSNRPSTHELSSTHYSRNTINYDVNDRETCCSISTVRMEEMLPPYFHRAQAKPLLVRL